MLNTFFLGGGGELRLWGRGDGFGPVVSVLAFHTDDSSLNPVEVYTFYSLKLCEK